eukprot:1021740-Amphidinium_carterae.1
MARRYKEPNASAHHHVHWQHSASTFVAFHVALHALNDCSLQEMGFQMSTLVMRRSHSLMHKIMFAPAQP